MVQNGIILTGYESGWFDWPDMHISIVLNGFHDLGHGLAHVLHNCMNTIMQKRTKNEVFGHLRCGVGSIGLILHRERKSIIYY